jgi:hypothetical protein
MAIMVQWLSVPMSISIGSGVVVSGSILAKAHYNICFTSPSSFTSTTTFRYIYLLDAEVKLCWPIYTSPL